MTSTNNNRFFLPAWGLSLSFHAVVIGLALAFVAQVKPVLPEDKFQWDVVLVEEPRSEGKKSEQVEPVVAPEQPWARRMLPSQTKQAPETLRQVMAAKQEIEPPQPAIESVQPTEQRADALQPREEPIEQRIAEGVEPKAEPSVEPKKPEPVAVAASTEPVQAQPVQRDLVADTSAPASSFESPASQDVPAQESSRDNSMEGAPAPSHEAKADNRWLAESLWRRVAELKRYPSSARVNGQEGKVILKAVIRSDGHLADVSVQKSSGYNVLDEAAIEAVRLACPLHMKHAIGKPQIVVSLPIVYSLAN